MATESQPAAAASLEEQVLELVRELLTELGSHRAARAATLDSSFDRDLGMGSLDLVELLVRCEARFDLKLPDEIAETAQTPAEWTQAIRQGGEKASAGAAYRIVQPGEAPLPPRSAGSLVEVLRRQAETEPDRVHIHLLDGDSGQDISYRRLLERANQVAAGLRVLGLGRNETVALMLPSGADFFHAFFGALLAGGTAVPIYPPVRPDQIEEYVRRQVRVLRNAEIRFLITFDRVKAITQLMRLNLPHLRAITTVSALREAGEGLPSRTVEPAEIAVIQYTSGSTGDPKGVVLRDANILANVRGIGGAVAVQPSDAVVSWLPLCSDMGLVGTWLFSFYYAVPLTVLSPLEFLSRPERWLWAIHDSRGTLSAAPNFAYELCARRIPAWTLEGMDLSCWRVAANAGELVLPETVQRFTERFSPFGFRPEAMLPCYGLAEASVALTMPPAGRSPRLDVVRRESFEKQGRAEAAAPGESDVVPFYSVGAPLEGGEVRIVDEQGREPGERAVGRLQFRGSSQCAGYYRNPQACGAVLDGDAWMDTGDLAYRADGEIFIAGRSKDSIIKAGRNLSPLDVESAAEEVPGVLASGAVAFGVTDPESGTERLIVAAETRATLEADLARVEAGVRRRVEAALGIGADAIVLAPPGSIPKTANGKVRRNEARALYLAGRLCARRRPTWFQLARLWAEHAVPWAGLAVRKTGAALRQEATGVLAAGIAAGAGVLARGHPALVGPAARLLLRLRGQRVLVEGQPFGGPVVLVANRWSQADALAATAALPQSLRLADSGATATLPRSVRFLLELLVLPPLDGAATPPSGTLQQRIERALGEGAAVLVFPEGAAGVPAHLSRFRLDAFYAAIRGAVPVIPVALHDGRIILGPPVAGGRDAVQLREAAREAIGTLVKGGQRNG